MSSDSTSWEFSANTPGELAKVDQAWPNPSSATVAGELFQMTHLLKALARTELLEYPCTAKHIGDTGVPDCELTSGSRNMSLEMAKVTTTNLEHARALQMKLPDPPSHFKEADLIYPDTFALKLKTSRNGWYRFVADRLHAECRTWLSTWNGRDTIPSSIKMTFVETLNSIIDGPAIKDDPALCGAFPPVIFVAVEGFPSEEKPRHRKEWLEEAFWEEWARPINPTLMISPFVRENDSRMTRAEVLEAGFIVAAMPALGPTLEQEYQIWLRKVLSEIEDKTQKLKSPNFRHGDEDWLVLWDRLGAPDFRACY